MLAREFGEENVFFDVDSITAGQDFRVAIREYLDDVDVMLALIGPRWDPSRLAVGIDYVRTELVEALRQAKPVIPVLIEDTPMPSPDQLPDELKQLAFLHALVVRPDPDFRIDAARVARAATVAHQRVAADQAEAEVTRLRANRALETWRLAAAAETLLRATTERDRTSADALTVQHAALAAEPESELLRAQEAHAEQTRRLAAAIAEEATARVKAKAAAGEGPEADPVIGLLRGFEEDREVEIDSEGRLWLISNDGGPDGRSPIPAPARPSQPPRDNRRRGGWWQR